MTGSGQSDSQPVCSNGHAAQPMSLISSSALGRGARNELWQCVACLGEFRCARPAPPGPPTPPKPASDRPIGMTRSGQSAGAETRLSDGWRLRATCNGKTWTVRLYEKGRSAPSRAATRGSLPQAVEALGVPMSDVVDAVRQ
jgi:hypothetical protein